MVRIRPITPQDAESFLRLNLVLDDEKLVETAGVSINSKGSTWTLSLKGDKDNVQNIQLIVGYKATVK